VPIPGTTRLLNCLDEHLGAAAVDLPAICGKVMSLRRGAPCMVLDFCSASGGRASSDRRLNITALFTWFNYFNVFNYFKSFKSKAAEHKGEFAGCMRELR
jgi:hypothetical protein